MTLRSSNTERGRDHARKWAPAGLLSLALVCSAAALFSLAGACSARAVSPLVGVNCAEEAPYEISTLDSNEPGSIPFGWYDYGDFTPGAVRTLAVGGTIQPTAIEDGGRCGSRNALFLTAHGYNDYGAGWGTYNLAAALAPDGAPCVSADGGMLVCPRDESAWEGLKFWARSHRPALPDGGNDPNPAPATRGFTISVNDKDSYLGYGSTCVQYDASFLANGTGQYSAPSGGSAGAAGGGVTSAYAPPNACGLGFSYPMEVTDQWHLYTIPWSAFDQLARPNRAAAGFDPSSLLQIVIVAPKEAQLALWIDDIGVYRTRHP